MTDNRTTEKLMREFVAVACECEVRDYLISEYAERIEQAIAATLGGEVNGETSDGYHTFNELYHHRAVLFSVIVENYRDAAWKAKKHHDGTMYDGMFILGGNGYKQAAVYWERMFKELLTERIGGKLTAEQVREAIFNGSSYASYDGAQYYANGIDMQAIADELNVELGSGTCELKPFADEDWSEPNAVRGVCSECSALMYGKDNYCPNCGKRIRKKVDE